MSQGPHSLPRVSIIIPVRNEETTLEKCLRSLHALDYPDFEILIIDDGSTDSTPGILDRFSGNIRRFSSSGKGPSFARNMGIRESTGELVAFTDGDCLVDPRWLRELVTGLKSFPNAVSCGGRQVLPSDATPFEQRIFHFMERVGSFIDYVRPASGTRCSLVRHNPSCNSLYVRSVLLEIGGFQADFWPGEDVDLDYRLEKAGHKLVYNPAALVFHYKPSGFLAFAKMMFSYGWAQGKLVRKFGLFRAIQGIPFFCFFLGGVVLVLRRRFGWVFRPLPSVALLVLLLLLFPFLTLLLFAGFAWNAGFFTGILQR